ncbi:hypothetical protein B0H14DRAFT_2446176, partial [Mycena olivaceomarginata]
MFLAAFLQLVDNATAMATSCWRCGLDESNQPYCLTAPSNPLSPDGTSFLTSNDAPQNSEILQIRNIVLNEETRVVESLQAELSGLYAQSHRLQSRIAHLVHRRREARGRADQHRPVLSPVHRLPAELICDIFALTLSGCDCIMPEPPWALGHVCGLWRQLALACPRLWSSVTIPAYERRDSRRMMETQL